MKYVCEIYCTSFHINCLYPLLHHLLACLIGVLSVVRTVNILSMVVYVTVKFAESLFSIMCTLVHTVPSQLQEHIYLIYGFLAKFFSFTLSCLPALFPSLLTLSYFLVLILLTYTKLAIHFGLQWKVRI